MHYMTNVGDLDFMFKHLQSKKKGFNNKTSLVPHNVWPKVEKLCGGELNPA